MEQEGALVVGGESRPLTANAVVARVRLIQEVMNKVMKKDTHYGTIPGCGKPSLWKPGAEQLLVTFRIAPSEPKVMDLSDSDRIRYRVVRDGISPAGELVASGVGECSSDEEKYKWRRPVCEAEFNDTAEDRRRLKYKRDGTSEKQVRTNPADVANTILKMADKRAFVAMALLATAASDVFVQDLEDLPPEVAESLAGGENKAANIEPPKVKPAAKPAETPNPIVGIPDLVSIKTGVSEPKKGEKEGRPWKKYGIKFGETFYGTFDEQDGELAKAAKDEQFPIAMEWKARGEYFDAVKVEKTEAA